MTPPSTRRASIRLTLDDWARDHHFDATPPPAAEDQSVPAADNPFAARTETPHSPLADGARRSVLEAHAEHERLIDERGVGRFYGSQSHYAKVRPRLKRAWLDWKLPDDVSTKRVMGELEAQDCIGWAMRHVKAGYLAAGERARWKKIERIVAADDFRGTTLARLLQEDGWTAIYFAPHRDRINTLSTYGRHAKRALEDGVYHGIRIDDYLVDYKEKPNPNMAKLESVPFFFGLVKSGAHTFAGVGNRVSEAHYMYGPASYNAVELRRIDDPRFRWTEGLLMVPPGTWFREPAAESGRGDGASARGDAAARSRPASP